MVACAFGVAKKLSNNKCPISDDEVGDEVRVTSSFGFDEVWHFVKTK